MLTLAQRYLTNKISMSNGHLGSAPVNRRKFLKASSMLAVGSAFGLGHVQAGSPMASNVIKVGLVGCGGRGTGAAVQALRADPNVIITALADIFEDRLAGAYHALQQVDADRTKVTKQQQYLGFDSYQQVINSDVDVVLLASPPYFRPAHLMAAVQAGKHIFCEKPFAVDALGVQQVLEAVRLSREKNIALVSGFCFRYDFRKRALFGQVLNRRVGEVLSVNSYRFGGELPYTPRQQEWTDLDYKMRN